MESLLTRVTTTIHGHVSATLGGGASGGSWVEGARGPVDLAGSLLTFTQHGGQGGSAPAPVPVPDSVSSPWAPEPNASSLNTGGTQVLPFSVPFIVPPGVTVQDRLSFGYLLIFQLRAQLFYTRNKRFKGVDCFLE